MSHDQTISMSTVNDPDLVRMHSHKQKLTTILKKHTPASYRLHDIHKELSSDPLIEPSGPISLTSSKPKHDIASVRKYLKNLSLPTVTSTAAYISYLRPIANIARNYSENFS